MVPHSTPAVALPASWWQRLLAAERQTLATAVVADERQSSGSRSPVRRQPCPLQGCWSWSRAGDCWRAVCAACAQWPLLDDSIDRVVLQHVLEAGGDVDELLDEAIRVLKPERSIALFAIGALGWTRCKLHFAATGAPQLRVRSTRTLLEALATRGCVDLRVSRVDFDGDAEARVTAPARIWSGLCLIEARKRREPPNVRQLRGACRAQVPVSSWVAPSDFSQRVGGVSDERVAIFTDGACSGNPGPAAGCAAALSRRKALAESS